MCYFKNIFLIIEFKFVLEEKQNKKQTKTSLQK